MISLQLEISNLISEKKYQEVISLLNSNFRDIPKSWCYNVLGICFTEMQDNVEAIKNFKSSIYYDQKDAKPYFNLALLYSSANEEKSLANQFFLKANELDSKNIYYKISYANYLSKLNSKRAANYYYQAIDLRPDLPVAYIGLTEHYIGQGKFKETVDICNKYFAKYKKHHLLLNNLATALIKLHRIKEAAIELQSSLKLNDKFYAPHLNLGICYYELGLYKLSIKYFITAMQINNSNFMCLFYYARALLELNKPLESIQYFRRAYKINKDPAIWMLISDVFLKFRRINFAIKQSKKSISLGPNHPNRLVFISHYIFALRYSDNLIEYTYLNEAKKLTSNLRSDAVPKLNINKTISKKPIIGFVSGDFNKHPVGMFLLNILEYLRKNFIINAYYNDRKDDFISAKLRKKFHSWKSIYDLTDVETCKLIRDDKVNILFDLSGHTSKNRLGVFKYRSAPIQISWIGYLASTGITEIDYIIADKYTVPEEHFKNFEEKIIQLPNIWNTYDYEEKIEKNIFPPCINNNYLTLGFFNNPNKINKENLELLSDLVLSNKNIKIIFKYMNIDHPLIKNKIINYFKKKSAPIENIYFESGASRDEFLKAYNRIDISIDPINYNGGSTSFESVMMGVPVMSIIGDTFMSRCGYSINMNLGLSKMIAVNKKDFIEKINYFYENMEELASIRKTLITKAKFSPLFDHKKLSQNLINELNNLLKNNY